MTEYGTYYKCDPKYFNARNGTFGFHFIFALYISTYTFKYLLNTYLNIIIFVCAHFLCFIQQMQTIIVGEAVVCEGNIILLAIHKKIVYVPL